MDSVKKNSKASLNLNIPAIIILILYPILLLIAGIWYIENWGLSSIEIIIALLGYYGSNIAVGIGLHRLWSHNAYKTKPWVETFLMLLSTGCLQGPVLAWVSDHRFHHAFADGEKDPHTPVKYKSKLKGFLWSHLGWMILGEATHKHIDRVTFKTLGRNKVLKWQLKYYWQLAIFISIVPPALLGCILLQSLTLNAAFSGFLFIAIGRALQQQATFCVNSLCHMVGKRLYTNDTSRDIWWLAPFLLGENWHNFHHAFAKDYRNGHKWYHLDIHKWIIWSMAKVGLAFDLTVTSDERISVKMKEMQRLSGDEIMGHLENIVATARSIAEKSSIKLKEIENTSRESIYNIADFERLQKKASEFAASVQLYIEDSSSRLKQNTSIVLTQNSRILKGIKKRALALGVHQS